MRFLFIVFICIATISQAHVLLKGKVLDADTQLPIKCSIKYSNTQISTDSLGYFLISSDTNVHFVEVSVDYYKTKIVKIPQNLPEILLIYLEPEEIQSLKDVSIEGRSLNSLNTISKIDLNARNVNNSQDILRIVPGLFIAQHAGGGKAEQIFLRGYDIDHGTDLNVSVDGMPVNMVSHAHGQGYADMHFIIPELVQNIDYGKGPYYAEVGNLGTAGYVKLKTIDVLKSSRASTETGQFNTIRNFNSIDLLHTSKKALNNSAYLASEIFRTNGPFESSQDLNRINFTGKYTHTTENSFLSIQGSYFSSKWNASGQIPTRAVNSGLINRFGSLDNTEGGSTGRNNLIVNYQYRPSSFATIDHSFYFTKYNFKLFSNFTYYLKDSVNGDQIVQKENRNMVGYNGSYSYTKSLGNSIWKQKYGVSIRYDQIDDIGLIHTFQRKNLNYEKLGDVNEYNLNSYTDQQFLFNKFTINFGLRVDLLRWEYVNSLDTVYVPFAAQKAVFLPKLNFLYNPTKKTQFYFKSGRGFHSNDTRTIVTAKGKGMLPSVYGTDLGVTTKPNDRLWINTALWYLYSEQEFVYSGDEGTVELLGKAVRKGLDLSARYKTTKWLFADIDITLANPRLINVSRNESYVPLAPKITLTGGLSFNFKNGINGNIRARYLANRPANEDNSITAIGYTVFDAGLFYTKKRYELGLITQNLFNVNWNEAQFATTSQLRNETNPVTELNYTPGTPFFTKLKLSYIF